MSAAFGLHPGTLLGSKFRVERILGQGGMGVVVAATHLELQREVAIKLLLPAMASDENIVMRFLREARAQVRIQGDHVVRVLDVGTLPSHGPFMVMELLHGMDLAEVLDTRGAQGLPIADATNYILQAADAIAQAHSLGIIHRDLKPQNLFLTTQPDGSALVKVLDFGIAKIALRADATHGVGGSRTTATGLLGSPAYMSPEQAHSPKDVTPLSDLWSLGVILYELFTNRMPFEATTLGGLLAAIAHDAPVDVRVHRPDLPDSIANVVMRCLAKDPSERPRDIAELALALAFDAPSRERALRIAQIVRRLSNRPPALVPPELEVAKTAFASTALVPTPPSPRLPNIDTAEAPTMAADPPSEWVSTIHHQWRPSSLRWLGIAAALALAVASSVVVIGVSRRTAAVDDARRAAAQREESSQQPAPPPPVQTTTAAPIPPPPLAATTTAQPRAAPSASAALPRTSKPARARPAPPTPAAAAPPTAAAAAPAPAPDVFDSRK